MCMDDIVTTILFDLKKYTSSIDEVVVDKGLLEKAVNTREEITQNEKLIKAYRFKYDVNGHSVSGFIALPKIYTRGNKIPCIMYNRGGSFDFGMVSRGVLMSDIATMASWGYVVVGTQYTGNSLSEGHDEFGGTNDLESVRILYTIVQGLTDIDLGNIGMFGESRGGMMTYILLKDLPVKAAVIRGGLTNLIRNAERRPEMQAVYDKAFGGSIEEKIDRSIVFSPHDLPDQTPILLLHGASDNRVSLSDATDLADKLQDLGRKYKLVVFDGGDHSLSTHRNEWLEQARSWFDVYLSE